MIQIQTLDSNLYLENDSTSADTSLITYATLTQDFLSSLDQLEIEARCNEILEIRETFRPFIETIKINDPFYSRLKEASIKVLDNGTYCLNHLVPVSQGISGTYFFEKQFVIKPFDEEAGCLNNPKIFRGIDKINFIRDNIPLYRSSMREALAYQVALSSSVGEVVPNTKLAIVQSSEFHDYKEGISTQEKLCSIQEYVPNSKTLFEAIWDLESQGLTKEDICTRFDQNDFENINLLIWITYDTDAHMGNILAYPKENGIFGLKKIDNGLTFPDSNNTLINCLTAFKQSKEPLSVSMKEKIAALNAEDLAEKLKIYGLESGIPALRERIALLQEYALIDNITIKALNKRLS